MIHPLPPDVKRSEGACIMTTPLLCNLVMAACYGDGGGINGATKRKIMQPAIRQLPAVVIAALISWLLWSRTPLFLVPLWAYVLVLGLAFLVVDYGIQVLLLKIKANKTQ